ncbi:type III-B CRISPR module RAMP protein Cmr6 [Odoribacter splanchnicus]|uniref:type III-B CRISPR module RAMP protein Cmr6 n=1 Tax=Odoribacter splanchnicus TaxID=28118 RepID=UPI0034B1FB31
MPKKEIFRDFSALSKLNQQHSDTQIEKKQKVGNTDRQCPNIGWLFYKDYYNGLQQNWLVKNPGKEVKENTESYFEKKNTHLQNAPYSLINARSVFKGISNICFELFTIYPGLLIGSGGSHETGLIGEIKLGFQFDYTTGLPYIPASSVKGMLRSMFPYSLRVKKKADELKKEIIFYRKKRSEYISTICKELKDDTGRLFTFDDGCELNLSDEEVKKLELSIFEGVDGEDKALAIRDRDLFFDALVVETKGKLLGLDFITPHKDSIKSPNPIQFLKVLPEVKFRFSFRLRNTELGKNRCFTEKMKKMLFKRILEDIGLGAKTNVGYGQFRK